ncbi:MAG: hypothetical protein ACKPKO_43930, partial [Candidatus Fonsibacter sp.]
MTAFQKEELFKGVYCLSAMGEYLEYAAWMAAHQIVPTYRLEVQPGSWKTPPQLAPNLLESS